MENLRPLCQMPSHTVVGNSAHRCPKFAQDCAKLGVQEIGQNLLCPPQKIFCLPFLATWKISCPFSKLEIFCWPFLATWKFVFTFLACFGHFLDLFGQFNQSRAPIFPCVPREFRGPDATSCPYYARRPPEVLGAITQLHRTCSA